MDATEARISKLTSSSMGKKALARGMVLSCRGMEAIWLTNMVMTSSWGFSSPIWRLPMIRIARMTVK